MSRSGHQLQAKHLEPDLRGWMMVGLQEAAEPGTVALFAMVEWIKVAAPVVLKAAAFKVLKGPGGALSGPGGPLPGVWG